ncbi:hypothetical protein CBR_g17888 [Chara braunii]|uniref:Reverse transcriptase RNase H-like domain-containing protein n=1 Tax=Chara braunii TaxID=69332 RepID=A0A388KVT9_CHABU|nr:hypothetical protein CBR_g17888 [Chara braunii]|eukprot:GBG74174.1 hypothetical protein CBR_g17888 [Chara braunii]
MSAQDRPNCPSYLGFQVEDGIERHLDCDNPEYSVILHLSLGSQLGFCKPWLELNDIVLRSNCELVPSFENQPYGNRRASSHIRNYVRTLNFYPSTAKAQGGELVTYAPEQPSPSTTMASTSGASPSDAADVVDPLEYLHLAGMVGAIRSAPDDLEWVDRESNPGPQFRTGEIDVLQALKQLGIRVPIPVGHLLTISEEANDKLLQHCQKNQKRFTYQRIQRMLKKKEGNEEVAQPEPEAGEPEATRIATISLVEKDHFVRARSVLWKSAEFDCEIWGKPFNALIDTRSSAVAISLDTVRKTRRLGFILPQSAKDNYVSVDEEAMNIVGIIENVAVKPEAISAILAQVGPSGLESVVEYASKSVPACKRNYAAPTGECYAALWGISHFRTYLYGRKFTLVTDHEPLLALKKSKDYSGMIGRWATVLQSMDFDIRYRKHERHGNADRLTRLHRPEKVLKSEEVIPWNEPEQEIGPRYGQSGRRQLIALELIALIVQLADDLSPDIYSQSDDSPALYIFERSLDPYLQWTACLEEPRDEDTLPSRQEYLKPYDIIPHTFYPRAEEVVIDDDDEEDEDEETSEEGSYSEHSEGELSEGEEEEEETGSEWEALPEEATRTRTEAEDPKAVRKREEIATGKRQLEFASKASLRIGYDPTRDPEPPKPEDGDPAAAT